MFPLPKPKDAYLFPHSLEISNNIVGVLLKGNSSLFRFLLYTCSGCLGVTLTHTVRLTWVWIPGLLLRRQMTLEAIESCPAAS